MVTNPAGLPMPAEFLDALNAWPVKELLGADYMPGGRTRCFPRKTGSPTATGPPDGSASIWAVEPARYCTTSRHVNASFWAL